MQTIKMTLEQREFFRGLVQTHHWEEGKQSRDLLELGLSDESLRGFIAESILSGARDRAATDMHRFPYEVVDTLQRMDSALYTGDEAEAALKPLAGDIVAQLEPTEAAAFVSYLGRLPLKESNMARIFQDTEPTLLEKASGGSEFPAPTGALRALGAQGNEQVV
jgi:hypothetical protein